MFPLSIDTVHSRRYLQNVKGLFKAEVYVATLADGSKVVCKDYSRFRGRPLAHGVARYLVKREYHVLKQLNDWQYSPQTYESEDSLILVQEYIQGRSIGRLTGSTDVVLERLQKALQQLHQQGIAHNDIHTNNIIVRAGDHPVLIDFTSATQLPKLPLLGWLQRKLHAFDQRHFVKIKQRLGSELNALEQQQLKRPLWLEWILKTWKKSILPTLKLLYKSN